LSNSISLADLLAAKKTITVSANEVEIEVEFRVGFWNRAAQRNYVAEGKLVADSNIELLAGCLTGWNVTDDGKPLPINVETLEMLDGHLILAIVDAVFEAVRPNPTNSQS
jgi:hypothetical protein